MHDLGLIGGTFDHFHDGHALLIQTMLERCERIEVWLLSESRAKSKDMGILAWKTRKNQLIERFADVDSARIDVFTLEDEFGPATLHKTAGAIACTKETKARCTQINSLRAENDLEPLEIIEVPHSLAWDNLPISSTRIRNGEIDRAGQPWMPPSIRSSNSSMTPEVEQELKKPFGELFKGPEDDTSVAINGVFDSIDPLTGPIIAVGDVTVLAIQDSGRMVDIAIIDGQTKRSPWSGANDIRKEDFDFVLHSINPAGMLTPSLLESCEKAIHSLSSKGHSTLIVVEGEEDLAPLLLHPLLPIGAVVLYGQPEEGVVLRLCSEESKLRCRNLLSLFESTSG